MEFSIEGLDYYPWQDNIFSPDFKIVDGHLELPHKLGWGVEGKSRVVVVVQLSSKLYWVSLLNLFCMT